MDFDASDLRKYYAGLSDDALLALRREELVEAARECYDAELARRNLAAVTGAAPGDEDLVEVDDSFLYQDEAALARALLEAEGIPCYLANENTLRINWMSSNLLGGLKLMVPRTFLDQAREVLAARFSDDELAAEAEAQKGPKAD